MHFHLHGVGTPFLWLLEGWAEGGFSKQEACIWQYLEATEGQVCRSVGILPLTFGFKAGHVVCVSCYSALAVSAPSFTWRLTTVRGGTAVVGGWSVHRSFEER